MFPCNEWYRSTANTTITSPSNETKKNIPHEKTSEKFQLVKFTSSRSKSSAWNYFHLYKNIPGNHPPFCENRNEYANCNLCGKDILFKYMDKKTKKLILSHPQVKVLGTSLSWLLGLSPGWDLAEWFSLNMLLGKSTSISLVMLIDWSLGTSLGWLLGLLPCWGV